MTVKCKASDVENLLQKDSGDGAGEVDITDPHAGLAEIYLQPADTRTLNGKYVFDVWVILPSGARHVVVGPSTLQVSRSVTVLA